MTARAVCAVGDDGAARCTFPTEETPCAAPVSPTCDQQFLVTPGEGRCEVDALAGAKCTWSETRLDCTVLPEPSCSGSALSTPTAGSCGAGADGIPRCLYQVQSTDCAAPRPAECRDAQQVVFAAGSCSSEGGAARCLYQETATDCSVVPAAACSGAEIVSYGEGRCAVAEGDGAVCRRSENRRDCAAEAPPASCEGSNLVSRTGQCEAGEGGPTCSITESRVDCGVATGPACAGDLLVTLAAGQCVPGAGGGPAVCQQDRSETSCTEQGGRVCRDARCVFACSPVGHWDEVWVEELPVFAFMGAAAAAMFIDEPYEPFAGEAVESIHEEDGRFEGMGRDRYDPASYWFGDVTLDEEGLLTFAYHFGNSDGTGVYRCGWEDQCNTLDCTFENFDAWGGTTMAGTATWTRRAAQIDWCRLQHPLAGTVDPEGELTVYGRVWHPGLTDRQDQVDEDPLLLGEAGFGPVGSDPASDEEWTWSAAIANPEWSGSGAGEPDNDEYMAFVAGAPLGEHALAFRFSFDGGDSWRYCDRDRREQGGQDGSADGYAPADAGSLRVADDPCVPNPCQREGQAICNEAGTHLLVLVTEGSCTPADVGGFV
ncbi:MAG: hypothetical protein FJ125_13750, partial [Deltaproteobacteria bacterium]|nr:hypothetical protein [Deltaproteobacteria bacterium]